jgi:hypothetical protein
VKFVGVTLAGDTVAATVDIGADAASIEVSNDDRATTVVVGGARRASR